MQAVPTRYRPTCSFVGLEGTMDPKDWATLQAWFADESKTTARITKALGVIGIKLSPQTVGRHRNGTCSCP